MKEHQEQVMELIVGKQSRTLKLGSVKRISNSGTVVYCRPPTRMLKLYIL